MSEVKMDQEYNEDVEQKFGVQRDAMEDEEDDTQIVEDEIPPPQMDFFDEIADEENTQIMADEILQITPIEQRSAVDCDESVKPKKKKSKASSFIIAQAAHDSAMSDDEEDDSCNSHPSFITDTAMSLEELPETSMMNEAGIEHEEALAFVKDLQEKHNMQVDSHSDSPNESDSDAGIISGDTRAHDDFFPAAFSTQPTVMGPLEFDFKKRVYDTLQLPCRLQGNNKRPTAAHPKAHTFKSCEQLNASIRCWKQDYSCFLDATRDTADEQSVDDARKSLNKWEIFLKSGKPTDQMEPLVTGILEYDQCLQCARVDLFDNVMIWGAPSWSDVSVQLTHGFPRRLIKAKHGGFTETNVTCTSKVTNAMLRKFAKEDVLSLCSQDVIEKTGLTVTELAYSRLSSINIKQALGRSNVRLQEAMYRYGIDFLKFKPLGKESLRELSEFVQKRRVSHLPSSEEDVSEGEAEADEQSSQLMSDRIVKEVMGDGRPLENSQIEKLLTSKLTSKMTHFKESAESKGKARPSSTASLPVAEGTMPATSGEASTSGATASTAAKAAIPEDSKASKVISLTEEEQLLAMLNKAARMLGIDRDDWETLQKLHFEKAASFLSKVGPNSAISSSPAFTYNTDRTRINTALISYLDSQNIKVLCRCTRQCRYTNPNESQPTIKDNIGSACDIPDCPMCDLVSHVKSLFKTCPQFFSFQISIAAILCNLRRCSQDKDACSTAKLERFVSDSFNIGRTRFYQLCNVGEITRMAPQLKDVNPSKHNTCFWEVFSNLGAVIKKLDDPQGKQFVMLYWKIRVLAVCKLLNYPLDILEQWLLKTKSDSKELEKIFQEKKLFTDSQVESWKAENIIL